VKRFTVYTNILTERSLFLKAARKPEWLAEDPRKPINLEDEDPEVFQAYLHCVYFGSETLDEHFDNFLREVGTRTQSEPAPVLLGDLQRFECPGAHELEDFFDERLPTPERTQVVYERKIAGVKRFVHVYFENGEEATQALQCYSDNARGWKFAFAASSIDLAVEGFDSLIQLYLLADKMQDLRTSTWSAMRSSTSALTLTQSRRGERFAWRTTQQLRATRYAQCFLACGSVKLSQTACNVFRSPATLATSSKTSLQTFYRPNSIRRRYLKNASAKMTMIHISSWRWRTLCAVKTNIFIISMTKGIPNVRNPSQAPMTNPADASNPTVLRQRMIATFDSISVVILLILAPIDDDTRPSTDRNTRVRTSSVGTVQIFPRMIHC
jgi:hypothetical protein